MNEDLMTAVSSYYGPGYNYVKLIRDFIGAVSLLEKDGKYYVAKLYRSEHVHAAVRCALITKKLLEAGICAPAVIPALDGGSTFEFGGRTGVLTEFIAGESPDADKRIRRAGEISLALSEAMDAQTWLPTHGREFFIGRYLPIIRRINGRLLNRFAELGAKLYSHVEKLPATFCHGDFHAGNMIENGEKIYLFDFDASAIASRAYDAATVCDRTPYFDPSPAALEKGCAETLKNLEAFRAAARLTDAEAASVPYWIGIRHYDIQATIIECLGDGCVDREFIEKQLLWLENWSNIIAREGINV